MSLWSLTEEKGIEKMNQLVTDEIILPQRPIKAVWLYADLQNPLLLKYEFNPRDFMIGAKYSYIRVHSAISSVNFANYSNGFARESEDHTLLCEVLHPKIYTACLEAARSLHKQGISTRLIEREVTSIVMGGVITDVVTEETLQRRKTAADMEKGIFTVTTPPSSSSSPSSSPSPSVSSPTTISSDPASNYSSWIPSEGERDREREREIEIENELLVEEERKRREREREREGNIESKPLPLIETWSGSKRERRREREREREGNIESKPLPLIETWSGKEKEREEEEEEEKEKERERESVNGVDHLEDCPITAPGENEPEKHDIPLYTDNSIPGPKNYTSTSSSSSTLTEPEEEEYPVGSVLATVDIMFECIEKYETKFGDGEELESERKSSALWTFRGCISGHTELNWKIVAFDGLGSKYF
eukprot:CAMPEP_0182438648 /NCGR_PEP_ID=MMETSP1167-20130531/85914_1 /TAXON_ID=2988 /ORGANISM="Mallomonas Sp, Strain CCMP3275" /LENGTH=420 /DNA_ID=CAMNT_0024632097 /DNA_START=137 /DNA_END=1399 /DNA_ORIENTATION=-